MQTTSDYFSLERSNVLKGLLAIGIVLGHLAWRMESIDAFMVPVNLLRNR